MNPEKGNGYKNYTGKNLKNTGEETHNRNERQWAKNEIEIAKEEKKLRIFSEALCDAEYYIGGGVGAELAEGAIKHRHGDIDIIVFEDEVGKIKKKLESKGFIVTKGESFGGHSFDARNFEITQESDEPHGENPLHIGIYVYKRNIEKGMAQQLDEDGDITKEFPLSYFNKENQTMDYKGSKLTVADLRLSAGFKIASDRSKDIKDIERIKPLLKSTYSKEEIEELRNVVKKNIETLFNGSVKHIFSNFLETGQEITGENIHKYFDREVKEKIAGLQDADYANMLKEFTASLRNFSPTAKKHKEIKKEFLAFVSDKLKPITNYHKNIVDKTLG